MKSIFTALDPVKIQATLDMLELIDAEAKKESNIILIRKFQYIGDGHYKYYHITLMEKSYRAEWGRIGSKPQSQVKTFPGKTSAQEAFWQKIREKQNKGYEEIS